MARLLALVALFALAASEKVTWVGSGSNNLWDNPANWEPSKIPQPADDITLPPNVNVLIGTANGANVNSISASGVTLSVVGCSVKVATTFSIVNSKIVVNAGAGTVSVATGWLNGTTSFAWGSGNIAGNWYVDTSASFDINGGGLQACMPGMIANHGTFTIRGGVLLNSTCPLMNWGSITVTSPGVNQVTTLLTLYIKNYNKLSIEGRNTVGAQTLQANMLSISAPIQWRPQAQGWIYDVELTAPFNVIEPANIFMRNVTGSGTISTIGATAKIVLSDGANLSDIITDFGYIQCVNGSLGVANLQVSGGILEIPKTCPTQIKTIRAKSVFALKGDGDVTTTSATFFDQTTIDANLYILEEVYFYNQLLSLNGLIKITGSNPKMIAGCLTDCQVPRIWNPADATKPGTLALVGTLNINASANFSLIVHSLRFSTDVSLSLLTPAAKVSLQDVNITIPTITLADPNVVFEGSTLGMAYTTLVGPKPGALIGVTYDGVYQSCASPCQGKPKPFFPYQYFQAIPSH